MQFIPAVDFRQNKHSINGKYSARDTCTYICATDLHTYIHVTKYACVFTLGVCYILFELVHSCISVDLSLSFVSSLFTSHKSLA